MSKLHTQYSVTIMTENYCCQWRPSQVLPRQLHNVISCKIFIQSILVRCLIEPGVTLFDPYLSALRWRFIKGAIQVRFTFYLVIQETSGKDCWQAEKQKQLVDEASWL